MISFTQEVAKVKKREIKRGDWFQPLEWNEPYQPLKTYIKKLL